ncbi:MAG: class I SAM-dependent methyltransferase [Gemmatimonadetes bacterium]|nr:class I SAM-dependent methyltransferase [Gemmatimonadota bacterium]
MTPPERSSYVYALRFRWLTPFYDALLAATMREGRFKPALVRQADIAHGQRVLDLGCGTGTLTVLVKRMHPGAEVIGLDGDAEVLARARAKAAAAAVEIRFERAFATSLPHAAEDFDRVLSSLLFHHLPHEAKIRSFGEIHRVLRRGGELHIADFGRPRTIYTRVAFSVVRGLDGFDNTADNAAGVLPGMLRQAGFADVVEVDAIGTVFGTVVRIAARKA